MDRQAAADAEAAGARPAGRPEPALLPPPLRVPLGLLGALAALVVVALGVRYAGHGRPGTVDARIWEALYGLRTPWRQVGLTIDYLGEPVGAAAVIAACGTGCLLLRRPRAAVLFVAGPGLAAVVATLLKPVVGRTINGGYLSYPSGHTAFLTALALVAAMLVAGRLGLGRTAGTLFVLAAAAAAGAVMGWAQVGLGAHYSTDVLGGWCTALAVTPATARLVDRMADRRAGQQADRMADAGRRQRH